MDNIRERLKTPNWERLWYIADALRYGMSVKEMYSISNIDPWFLEQIKEIVELEMEIELSPIESSLLRKAKEFGFSDHRVSELLNLEEVAQVLRVALQGMKDRGEGTQVGDKTLVDALEPAVNAFAQAASDGKPAAEVLTLALEAAREGSESTIPLVARKGRASYLGQRSVGHRDAGSVVICHIFEAACEFCQGEA